MSERKCSVNDCDRRHYAKNYCEIHWWRMRQHGSATYSRPTALDRFHKLVNKRGGRPPYRPDFGECWLWLGAKSKAGYGSFSLDGKKKCAAYRWSWITFRGPIPPGLEIDHLCRNPSCVRPEHLEPVTPEENRRRGLGIHHENARKTHCPQGHPFTPENTYYNPNGSRKCRTCHLARCRVRDAARRGR